MRTIVDTDFAGKTIVSVSNESVNVLKFTFSDGSNLELWAEPAVFTQFGNISGFFVEEIDNQIAE